MNKLTVLSLCDGIACGRLALERAGIPVGKYYASEIKPIAIQCATENWPDIIEVGDVNKISYENGVLHTEKGDFETGPIDLVIFGSPCQTFSVCMRTELRIGLEDKEKSGLFLECHRILTEVNPKWFFVENVASMKDEDKNVLTRMLGVEPVKIDSKICAPAMRKRLYWTNIPHNRPLPKNDVKLKDILTSGYTERDKARALLVSDSRPLTSKDKMIRRFNKGFGTLIWEEQGNDESVRYMNQVELERCQTVPDGYTKMLTRNEAANVLGDGWTIDVVKWFFEGLQNAN